jgi:hypothetical protein
MQKLLKNQDFKDALLDDSDYDSEIQTGGQTKMKTVTNKKLRKSKTSTDTKKKPIKQKTSSKMSKDSKTLRKSRKSRTHTKNSTLSKNSKKSRKQKRELNPIIAALLKVHKALREKVAPLPVGIEAATVSKSYIEKTGIVDKIESFKKAIELINKDSVENVTKMIEKVKTDRKAKKLAQKI